MTRVELLFTRPAEGFGSHKLDAAMLVSFGVTEKSGKTEGEVMETFKRAVNRWVLETDQGKEAWEDSSYDLNVGDLFGSHEGDEDLDRILADEGLFEVKCVWSLGEGAEYPYDTVLAEHDD
jgi:hypothetical protein